MSNIHSVLAEGSAIQLGPVTVSKTYPRKPGDKNRFVLIEDSSGKGALKIWGAAANTELVEGQVITLVGTGPKGGLKTSEYNGRVSIDANDCRLELAGQAPPQGHAHPQAYATPQASVEPVGYDEPRGALQAPHAAPGGDKLPDVMKRCALATRLYIDELTINQGFTNDEAILLAQNAPAYMPLWWFGEKGMA